MKHHINLLDKTEDILSDIKIDINNADEISDFICEIVVKLKKYSDKVIELQVQGGKLLREKDEEIAKLKSDLSKLEIERSYDFIKFENE